MNRRSVVITGIGAITPVGSGGSGLWEGVVQRRCAVRRITRFDPSSFRPQLAAEIPNFDPCDHMDARTSKKLDRFAQLALSAARGAIEDAGYGTGGRGCQEAGVAVGTALGGVAFGEGQHSAFLQTGIRGVSPGVAVAVYGGAGAANIAINLGLRGPNTTNANSCASGAMAVGEALRIIERGEADMMVAGGAEAPLAPLTFGAFARIRAMSLRNGDAAGACRPFDRERDGFVMGEGAAMLVLEERRRAVRRGAHIYAELAGYAQTNDAYHMTAPRPDGSEAARAIRLALADARVRSEEVDYVNAHATGTPLGDAAEACALQRAFGVHGENVPVSGTKGLYGHPLGASGAIEICITALAMGSHFLPGTTNLGSQDPGCLLHLVPPEGCYRQIQCALTTSFGFGGANAALVLRRQAES